MSRVTQGGAVVGLLIAIIGAFEGLRLAAYPDPATHDAPWTICYGHTEGVRPGDRRTMAECKALLRKDLEVYAAGIEACVTAPLPDKRYVALVSFAYNVGVNAACRSSVVRLINAGQTKAGCDALLKYNRAARVVFPGLTKRRQKERELCLAPGEPVLVRSPKPEPTPPSPPAVEPEPGPPVVVSKPPEPAPRKGFWAWLKGWFS